MEIRTALVVLLASVTVAAAGTQGASAHVLESNGPIGAVLHIDPGDDPVAGEQSSFFFDFKDKTGRFKAEDCDCRLVVERAGTAIFDEPFSQPSGGSFVFPARDVYTVKAVGQPRTAGAFDSFSLGYDIRVERAAAGMPAAPDTSESSALPLIAVIGGSVGLFAVLGLLRYRLGNKPR